MQHSGHAVDPVELVRGAAGQLRSALLAGPAGAGDDGADLRAVVLEELAGLVQLAAATAQTSAGRRSVEVEVAAGELSAALCALRGELADDPGKPSGPG